MTISKHPSRGTFFPEGYLEEYPDIREAGVDPWEHYVLYGKAEGRDNGRHPSRGTFFPEGYLEEYPDIREAGVDPWEHYVLYGKAEGRDNGENLNIILKKFEKIRINLDYYSDLDKYSDGEVEDKLLEVVNQYRSNEYDLAISKYPNWPFLYHLSPARENLVEWIEIEDRETILEVGSGCGALTGLFSRKAKHVTCIEISKLRSLINAKRHKGRDNIDIIIGNFQNIEKDLPDFDIVTLIGVLEYARSYIHGDSPFENFLRAIRCHIKPGGRLILAIENRLGLKYWAGCSEDHTGGIFDSIEGYPGGGKIQTFSKKELKNLLDKTGYSDITFYYPYPDYKLPSVIYSDMFLPKRGEFKGNVHMFYGKRLNLFNEGKVFNSLIDNDLFSEFSNSFLIIAKLG